MDPVRVTTARGVMTATLVDVQNRNALGGALVGGLLDAVSAANADPAVRARDARPFDELVGSTAWVLAVR